MRGCERTHNLPLAIERPVLCYVRVTTRMKVKPQMHRTHFVTLTCLLAGFVGFISACAPTAGNKLSGGARVEGQRTAAVPTVAASRIYVEDFSIDVEAAEPKKGILGRPRFLSQLGGEDPATHARRIVDELAISLVKDLNAAGVPAERLPSGGSLPSEGWLIRGVFSEADTGNRLRRAVIGFGSGKTDMEVQVGVADLAVNAMEAFLLFGTLTDPSRLPGGLVTRNPYVVAAKFVLEKGAPRRDVEHTAKAITDEILKFRDQVKKGQVTLPAKR
jgi:hypothetical protein